MENLRIKPYVDSIGKVASNNYENELKGLDFQVHCLNERRWMLQAAIETVQVLGLSFDDFCKLQAAKIIGQTLADADRRYRWDRRNSLDK